MTDVTPSMPKPNDCIPQPGQPSMNLVIAEIESIGGWLRRLARQESSGSPAEESER